jgi:hypothetical protein
MLLQMIDYFSLYFLFFLEMLAVGVLLLTMTFFVYMSSHMISERKTGKTIPLPWEKGYKFKLFNKDDVKYRDGDNT